MIPPAQTAHSGYVVAGTDTGIGKTVFAAALTVALGGHYWKPIQAGRDGGTDAETVARLTGLPPARILPEAYVLEQPAAPAIAARTQVLAIDPARLALPRCGRPASHGPLVVELAGGLLVPITDELLQIDLLPHWGLAVILVATTRLGTINLALLSLEALRARAIPVVGVAFVGAPEPEAEAAIARFSKTRRLGRLPRLDPLTPTTLATAFAENFAVEDFR